MVLEVIACFVWFFVLYCLSWSIPVSPGQSRSVLVSPWYDIAKYCMELQSIRWYSMVLAVIVVPATSGVSRSVPVCPGQSQSVPVSLGQS